MRSMRSSLSQIAWETMPDGSLTRVRLRITAELLLTLGFALMALSMAVSYQVLRHLPRAWRDGLLGDDVVAE